MLALFLGADMKIQEFPNEGTGRLYGGEGGNYIYKSINTYKISSASPTNVIFRGMSAGLTNIISSTAIKTVLGVNYFPRQKFLIQPALSETTVGWETQTVLVGGECSDLLSDDGDSLSTIPVLTGNFSHTGNVIDELKFPDSSVKSDTGLPIDSIITDLEAAT